MPRTRSLKWSELKIGIMAVVALFIAAALILALGGEGGFFWERYNLKVKFSNAGGVQEGSPVRVAGVTVGAVTDLEFAGSHVEMTLHQRQHDRGADSGMGIRAVGCAAGPVGRRDCAGEQGDHRVDGAHYGYSGGQR